MIAAGGTGGHIFPGLAVAEAIRRKSPETPISFLGTRRGLESRLIPEAGFELDFVDMVPFSGSDRLKIPYAAARSVFQTGRIIRERSVAAGLGMGGYASFPLAMAARLWRVPFLVHESGATIGKANLLAARLTPHVALAFGSVHGALPRAVKPRIVGMPLRETPKGPDRTARQPLARKRLGVPSDRRLLLVAGGSQGAASLNRLALDLARRWKGSTAFAILLKTGPKHQSTIVENIEREGLGDTITSVEFIERMEDAYAAADLAVTRAGAGTVAELAVQGLPAILVPYPHAPGDHQTLNAKELVDAGGALLVRDRDLMPSKVGSMIESILSDPGRLDQMCQSSLSVARPNAAQDLAAWVLELAEHR